MTQADTLDARQGSHTFPRRMRQPELDSFVEDKNPAPLRHSKVSRRESRLGLRNIFARSPKTTKEDGTSSFKIASRSASLRASLAEMAPWPYGQQARSEITLPTVNQPCETSQESSHMSRVSSKPSRNALATWSMPPLFKAYPQAVRHGSLPAVAMTADAILRLNEKKHGPSPDPTAIINEIIEEGNQQAGDKERPRRRNRSDSLASANLQWITKIYVLATSGYLLQYSAEGHFDRLPEKVLRLGKSSVAFATDVIPGRHWVLQVSSVADGEGAPSPDSRSLFSKLPFRMPDRRHTSTMFMVFESAEDMDEWIASLRSEIGKLGGKKNLSETGAPKADDDEVHLRPRPSQRTIVIKDPGRFSRSATSSPFCHLEQEQEPRTSDCSTVVTDFDATTHDASLDDVSTTNSVVSHDGRQLDNLRDSCNRLSLLSSGQRTVVTSTTSSPAASPILDRFPRPGDGLPSRDATATPEARPRPNAGVILNRRMSLQTIGPFVGEVSVGGATDHRPVSSSCGPAASTTSGRGDGTLSPLGSHPTPNFSVPHSSMRRFSYAKTSMPDQETPYPQQQDGGAALMPRSALRKLSSIRTGRPLSTVEDQPSPRESIPERPVTSHHARARPTTPVDVPKVPRGRLMSVHDVPSRDEASGRRLSLMPSVAYAKPIPLSGATTRSDMSPARPPTAQARYAPLQAPVAPWIDSARRRRPSLDPTEMSRSFSIGFSRAAKRASFCSMSGDGVQVAAAAEQSLPSRAPPPTGPLPATPPRPSTSSSKQISVKVAMQPKVLVSKRSMPQLVVQGPPPAPPPTCALPPIPRKPSLKT